MKFTTKENSLIGEKYYYGKHKSGLEIFVIPKEMKQSFAIFGTRYGSMDRTFRTDAEADFITVPDGIAHYLEHKMFENEDGVDTFSLYAAHGADANAFTTNEMTAYLFSATAEYYENLKTLLDFVTHPYFTEETVAKEQGIIGQEITMYDDSPYWSLYQNMLRALYQKNNVRIDIAGTIDSIAEITPEILYRCYDTFYNLNNMTLVVCGGFEPDRVAAVCDEVLKPSKDVRVTSLQPEEPREICESYIEKSFPIAVPMFMIGLKETDLSAIESSEDRLRRSAEHDILIDILFGKSSKFYFELYNQGLFNDRYSPSYEMGKNFSHIELFGESREPKKVFSLVRELLDSAKKGGIKKEDFERSRKSVYARAVSDWNSTSDIAESFLDLRFVGCDMLDEAQIISEVTFEDVLARLEKSCDTSLMALSVINPSGKEDK